MANLQLVARRSKESAMPIDKLCKVKTYLTVKEKFEFLDEYKKLLKEHIQDYKNYESFVAYIFFDLMAVKKYTDIDIKGTYEEYDILQESGLMNKILDIIGEDYILLMKLMKENK